MLWRHAWQGFCLAIGSWQSSVHCSNQSSLDGMLFSSCTINETNKAAFSGSLVGCKQMRFGQRLEIAFEVEHRK
jgi:hypothetical protein